MQKNYLYLYHEVFKKHNFLTAHPLIILI